MLTNFRGATCTGSDKSVLPVPLFGPGGRAEHGRDFKRFSGELSDRANLTPNSRFLLGVELSRREIARRFRKNRSAGLKMDSFCVMCKKPDFTVLPPKKKADFCTKNPNISLGIRVRPNLT